MTPTVRDNEAQHRYELAVDDAVAVSVYRRKGKITNFLHTEVPANLAGRGIASTLIRGALDNERAQSRKVIATCTFVARFIANHADYQDLLANNGERAHMEDKLDEALTETFPASDPLAVTPRRH